eukprot:GHRR01019049.1.p1 GENE.GHRR01019049.1~~GHRR01019049.1.p1  ORF type:complete len:253 (+),score=57.54 GHRR01019049.1:100-858(+)
MHLQPVANHRLQLGSNWQLTLCWPAQCAVHCKPHHRPAEAWPARAQPVSTRRVRPPGWHTTRCANHSTNLVALTEPLSTLDVDRELWAVLDLCSDEELESLYNILFGASPFSPIVKSIVKEDEPPLLQLRGRSSIMHKVESRFRFLAADSTATLRGKRPSYREALLLIRDRCAKALIAAQCIAVCSMNAVVSWDSAYHSLCKLSPVLALQASAVQLSPWPDSSCSQLLYFQACPMATITAISLKLAGLINTQ